MNKTLLPFLVILFTVNITWGQNSNSFIKNSLPIANASIISKKANAQKNNNEKTLSCVDTLRYPQVKEQVIGTSTFYIFELWATDVELMSQTYLLSGSSITINGIEVFARNKPGTGAALNLKASIYNVDGSNNPTTVIGFGTITIATTDTNYLYRQINFSSPLTVSNNYAVVIEPTTSIVQLYVNNITPTQSYDENLSRVKSNYYTASGGNWVSVAVLTNNATDFPSGPYDFEALVAPKVSYSINTDFTISSNPGCTGNQINFTNTTTPSALINTRMYNYNIFRTFFQSIPDSTYVWDVDGVSPLIWTTNTSFIYSTASTYDPTLYTLGGFWNSCLDIKTVSLPILSVPASPGQITGNTTVCAGTTQVYSVGTVAGATSYTWTLPSGTSGSSTSNSISATIGTQSGVISVAANNSCGVSSVSLLNISVDVAIPPTPGPISGTTDVCNATSQTYSVGAVTGATSYTWTIPGDWTGSSTTTSINTNTGTQSGSITVTASNTCGISAASVLPVTVATVDDATFTYSSNTFCTGGTNPVPTINASGNFSSNPPGLVFLSTTTGEIDLSASIAGNYNITYNTSGTCPSSSSQGMTIVNAPDASFSYASNNYCKNATNPSPILGSGAFAGIFSATPAGLSIIPVTGTINLGTSTPGTYTVTNEIAASGSCPAVSHSFILTVNPLPTVTLTPFSNVCSTDPPLTLTGGLPAGGTYSGTGVSGGVFDPAITGVGTFNILYSYTDINNCDGSANQNITVEICQEINQFNFDNNLSITPNPAKENINIIFENVRNNNVHVKIITADGRVMYSKDFLNINLINQNIDVSQYDKGLYFVQIFSEEKVINHKIIIY